MQQYQITNHNLSSISPGRWAIDIKITSARTVYSKQINYVSEALVVGESETAFLLRVIGESGQGKFSTYSGLEKKRLRGDTFTVGDVVRVNLEKKENEYGCSVYSYYGITNCGKQKIHQVIDKKTLLRRDENFLMRVESTIESIKKQRGSGFNWPQATYAGKDAFCVRQLVIKRLLSSNAKWVKRLDFSTIVINPRFEHFTEADFIDAAASERDFKLKEFLEVFEAKRSLIEYLDEGTIEAPVEVKARPRNRL